MKTPDADSQPDPRLDLLLRQMPAAYHSWEDASRHPRFNRIAQRVAQLLAAAEKKSPPDDI